MRKRKVVVAALIGVLMAATHAAEPEIKAPRTQGNSTGASAPNTAPGVAAAASVSSQTSVTPPTPSSAPASAATSGAASLAGSATSSTSVGQFKSSLTALDVSTLLERAAASASSFASNASNLADSALAFLGVSYRFGGNSPDTGFDCSGLVRRVFKDALGLNLPRTAKEMSAVGSQVKIDDLKPGDLVFFNTMRNAFSHVGIYLGDNKFVHAPSAGGVVRVEDMRVNYWKQRFDGARRVGDETKAN